MSSLLGYGRHPRRFSSTSRADPTSFRRQWSRTSICATYALTVLAACSDSPLAPERNIPTTDGAGTTLRWNLIARQLVIAEGATPPRAARAYANLSVAQYVAARAVTELATGGRWPVAGVETGSANASQRAAIATASAELVRFLFPSHAVIADRELASQLAALENDAESLEAIEAGRTLGVAVAAAMTERAAGDRSNAPWSGTAPTGDFVWSGPNAQDPHWGDVLPWLAASGRALRAPPPPAPGSAAFLDALGEVRSIAEHRTQAQLDAVFYWADGPRTPTPAGHWNEIAAGLIDDYRLSEEAASATLARMNMAVMDAVIGCWDSKFAYWLARPYQVDPGIQTVIGQPPHPSYPSGHACMSGAASAVLASVFPAEGERLIAMEKAACDSRIFAGLHYRFDSEAGQQLGAAAARLALGEDLPAFARSLVHDR